MAELQERAKHHKPSAEEREFLVLVLEEIQYLRASICEIGRNVSEIGKKVASA
jgi:hypothetical protein